MVPCPRPQKLTMLCHGKGVAGQFIELWVCTKAYSMSSSCVANSALKVKDSLGLGACTQCLVVNMNLRKLALKFTDTDVRKSIGKIRIGWSGFDPTRWVMRHC